jgi:hypothetical protein
MLDQLDNSQVNAHHADDGPALDQLAADDDAHHFEAPPEPQALVSTRHRRGLLGFVVDIAAGLLPRKARATRPPLRLVPAPQHTDADVIEGVIIDDPPAPRAEHSIIDALLNNKAP